MAIERCETGIAELDQIMRGGIPVNSIVLLCGGSGMGKTTLALEFLSHGAENGQNGLFVSVTESLAMLQRNAKEYLFLRPELLDEGKLRLIDFREITKNIGVDPLKTFSAEEAQMLVDGFAAMVKENNIKRVVIDSITAICQRIQDAGRIRDFTFALGLALADLDCTTIMTSETPPRELKYSMYGVEEFIADGIIFLSETERHNDLVRTLQVIKMRGTDHSRAKFMMDLSEFGISLAPMLKKFSEVTPV